MQRYFHNSLSDIITLDDMNSNHIINVMRNKINDSIFVCIDMNYYEYKILSVNHNVVKAKLANKLEIYNELETKVTHLIPLLKKENHKIAIQKSIELGADNIFLYEADNTVVKWKNPGKKLNSLSQYCIDSCRQSFRNKIVNIQFIKLEDIDYDSFDILLFGDETQNNISSDAINGNVLFITGCEGGFSKREYNIFNVKNIHPYSVAKTILRAETAPIAFQSIINYKEAK